MSKSKINKVIDYLSEPRKGIVALVLLVLVVIAAVFVWKKVRNVTQASSKEKLFSDNEIESGTGTVISGSLDFAHLVSRLWAAVVGMGTNEAEVYAVLGCLNTQADYMKLCRAWLTHWQESGWFARQATEPTLPGQLQAELDKTELAKARNILSGKGIEPDF